MKEGTGDVEEGGMDPGVHQGLGAGLSRSDGGGRVTAESERATRSARVGCGEWKDEQESARVCRGIAASDPDREVAAFQEGGQFGLERAGPFAAGGMGPTLPSTPPAPGPPAAWKVS
jgi:hypothetical protein